MGLASTKLPDSRIQTAVSMLCAKPAVSVRHISFLLGLSESRLEHLFKEQMGCPIREFRKIRRLDNAVCLLELTDKPMKEIAWLLGYRHTSNFNHAFHRNSGRTPQDFRLLSRK